MKDIVLGPEVYEGAWRPLKRPDSRFVERWGTLFEENRGPPMVLKGASFRADPVTGALLLHGFRLKPCSAAGVHGSEGGCLAEATAGSELLQL